MYCSYVFIKNKSELLSCQQDYWLLCSLSPDHCLIFLNVYESLLFSFGFCMYWLILLYNVFLTFMLLLSVVIRPLFSMISETKITLQRLELVVVLYYPLNTYLGMLAKWKYTFLLSMRPSSWMQLIKWSDCFTLQIFGFICAMAIWAYVEEFELRSLCRRILL